LAGCSRCSGHAGGTQPPVVIHEGAAECASVPAAPARDPYDAALARARCEHPDMLVHPRGWILRRVPSPPAVVRFALDQTLPRTTECCYEVDGSGAVRRAP